MEAKNNNTGQQQHRQQPGDHRQLLHLHLHSTATTAALNGSKSLIDKDNLRDEDFDKLVINISELIGKSRLARNQSCEERKTAATTSSEQCCSNSSLSDDRGGDSSCGESPSRLEIEQHRSLGQPKRPMNAFMVWGRAIRREIHLRFSNVQNALLSKALGRVWRSLDSAAKEPYVRKANLIKANHKRDYPDYRYQPRRVQERERSKAATDEAPTSTDRPRDAPAAAATVFEPTTIYSSINGVYRRRPEHPVVGGGDGSRRLNGMESASHSMGFGPYYVSNFACQDNSNHIDGGLRNGIHCAADNVNGNGGGSASGISDRVQYHDEFQQQHRPLACGKQQDYSTANAAASVYSYPGSAYQHQFAYNMQFQQQQQLPQHQQHQLQHTYHQQQSHLHTTAAIMQQPPFVGTSCNIETTSSSRMSYVENCSLSAAAVVVNTGGLDISGSNRLLAVPSAIETNGASFARSYETRN